MVTYELAEGDVSSSALVVSSTGSADLTTTFSTIRNGLQEINIATASTTPIGIVSELNSAVATIGLNAQLINDGSGSSDPYKILLTGATGEENEFTITTTSSQAEVQNLSFGTAQSTGSFTVAGVSVSVSAGETPIVIAVKAALDADGFITNSAGRSISILEMVSSILTTRVQMATLRFPLLQTYLVWLMYRFLSQHLSRQIHLWLLSFSSVQSATDAKLIVMVCRLAVRI